MLLSLFVIAATGLDLLLWAPRAASQVFNLSPDDLLWQAAAVALLLIAALTLFTRRPNGFGNGVAIVAILLEQGG